MGNAIRLLGRPRGSGKNDAPYLAKVAELLIGDPSLKPTTAMKRVIRGRTDWDANDPTLLRRWQVKWKADGPSLLCAAQKRVRYQHRAASVGSSELLWTQAAKDFENSPWMRAIRATENLPIMRVIKDMENSPWLRAIRAMENLPIMRVIKDMEKFAVVAGHHKLARLSEGD